MRLEYFHPRRSEIWKIVWHSWSLSDSPVVAASASFRPAGRWTCRNARDLARLDLGGRIEDTQSRTARTCLQELQPFEAKPIGPNKRPLKHPNKRPFGFGWIQCPICGTWNSISDINQPSSLWSSHVLTPTSSHVLRFFVYPAAAPKTKLRGGIDLSPSGMGGAERGGGGGRRPGGVQSHRGFERRGRVTGFSCTMVWDRYHDRSMVCSRTNHGSRADSDFAAPWGHPTSCHRLRHPPTFRPGARSGAGLPSQ